MTWKNGIMPVRCEYLSEMNERGVQSVDADWRNGEGGKEMGIVERWWCSGYIMILVHSV